jgi:membrane dipeptidase
MTNGGRADRGTAIGHWDLVILHLGEAMAIVVDAHSDMLSDLYGQRTLGEMGVLEKTWVPGMKAGGIDLRVAAIYSGPQYLPELALRRALDQVATLLTELEGSSGARLCITHADILRARAEGKRGFILGMEGVEPLGSDLALLRIFYALGLRVMGLTHALRNYAADGAFFDPKPTGQVGGLSDFGVSLVMQAQAMGIVIDVSHLNDPGFWDVIKLATGPIIASHSNCRVLMDHARNLTDEQIKAVADTGGVIGINAASRFTEPPDLPHLMDHLDHLVKVAGREHVGLGLDFCQYLLQYKTELEKARLRPRGYLPVEGLDGDRDVPKIPAILTERGYSPDTIDLIMGENFLRVFKTILKR